MLPFWILRVRTLKKLTLMHRKIEGDTLEEMRRERERVEAGDRELGTVMETAEHG